MFTGLVQEMGAVKDVTPFGKGKRFRVDIGSLGVGCKVGQSIAVNGVCLTVTSINGNDATFDSVSETVSRSNLGFLKAGSKVNLEPALKAGDALDGHIVLGHVDALATVIDVAATASDDRVLVIALPKSIRALVAEKGSVAINGISLTVATAGEDQFTVAVIPLTWANTTLGLLKPGDGVNLEADVLARYAARILQYGTADAGQGISVEFLQENGFA